MGFCFFLGVCASASTVISVRLWVQEGDAMMLPSRGSSINRNHVTIR